MAGEPSANKVHNPGRTEAFGLSDWLFPYGVALGVGSNVTGSGNIRPPSFKDPLAMSVPFDLSDASVAEGFDGEVEPSDPGEEGDIRRTVWFRLSGSPRWLPAS